jgi:hypothetical protein
MRRENWAPWTEGRSWARRVLPALALGALGAGCTGAGPSTEGGGPRSDAAVAEAKRGGAPTALVAAGGRSRSARYVLDQTAGQPTQVQARAQSGGYVANGGLIGAEGDRP